MFEIKDGRLLQDGVDVSEQPSEVLKQQAEVLATYSKYRLGIEKLNIQVFGDQKKKAPAKKPAAKPAETDEVKVLEDGRGVNTTTGEVVF